MIDPFLILNGLIRKPLKKRIERNEIHKLAIVSRSHRSSDSSSVPAAHSKMDSVLSIAWKAEENHCSRRTDDKIEPSMNKRTIQPQDTLSKPATESLMEVFFRDFPQILRYTRTECWKIRGKKQQEKCSNRNQNSVHRD